MYDLMITICLKAVKRVDPKSLITRKNMFFFTFYYQICVFTKRMVAIISQYV